MKLSISTVAIQCLWMATNIDAFISLSSSQQQRNTAFVRDSQQFAAPDVTEWADTKPSEAKLIVIQVTDVYTLENFAHLKTLVEETRAASDAKVVCMLTGDFLSPYLLSAVDDGAGMMHALNSVPMDYLTWGNHEADIAHDVVCEYVRDFPGKWLNSNMLDHDEMDNQLEYDVIECKSKDGSQTRKIGLTAVLSNDPALYSHFTYPGAFGGATITDPWEALTKYETILRNDEGCDMVLPLQHLYVPDDHKTCRKFNFEVVLSGHDHHKVDEMHYGTRLIKPGMNAESAAIVEISWPDANSDEPVIKNRFVQCKDWKADAKLAEENERAYDCLLPLRNTELARVPPNFEPLTSNGSRDSVCTMGKFICSLLRTSLNDSRSGSRAYDIDAVVLMGGNIRGNADYELGSFFSLEALEAEIKADEVVGTVPMPGWLLAKGIEETHAGEPIPGWVQYDDGVTEDENGKITHIAGEELDENRTYRVTTKISDLTNGQSPAWTEYFTENEHLLPKPYVNIHAELMGHFSKNLWRKLFEVVAREAAEEDGEVDIHECMNMLDQDGDGEVTVDEIQLALEDKLGYSVDPEETTLAELVHQHADQTGDGSVTEADLIQLAEQDDVIPELLTNVRPVVGIHMEDRSNRNEEQEDQGLLTLPQIPKILTTALWGSGDTVQP